MKERSRKQGRHTSGAVDQVNKLRDRRQVHVEVCLKNPPFTVAHFSLNPRTVNASIMHLIQVGPQHFALLSLPRCFTAFK